MSCPHGFSSSSWCDECQATIRKLQEEGRERLNRSQSVRSNGLINIDISFEQDHIRIDTLDGREGSVPGPYSMNATLRYVIEYGPDISLPRIREELETIGFVVDRELIEANSSAGHIVIVRGRIGNLDAFKSYIEKYGLSAPGLGLG